MPDIHFIDTTLRDGQQSLWALGMKTGGRGADGPHRFRVDGIFRLDHDQEVRP